MEEFAVAATFRPTSRQTVERRSEVAAVATVCVVELSAIVFEVVVVAKVVVVVDGGGGDVVGKTCGPCCRIGSFRRQAANSVDDKNLLRCESICRRRIVRAKQNII